MSKKDHPEPKSNTKKVIPRRRSNAQLLRPPAFFLGEDPTAYDELHARFRAEVEPVGMVEQMYCADVALSTFELLRWRRL